MSEPQSPIFKTPIIEGGIIKEYMYACNQCLHPHVSGVWENDPIHRSGEDHD